MGLVISFYYSAENSSQMITSFDKINAEFNPQRNLFLSDFFVEKEIELSWNFDKRGQTNALKNYFPELMSCLVKLRMNSSLKFSRLHVVACRFRTATFSFLNFLPSLKLLGKISEEAFDIELRNESEKSSDERLERFSPSSAWQNVLFREQFSNLPFLCDLNLIAIRTCVLTILNHFDWSSSVFLV